MRKISTLLRHILVSALSAALAVGPAAPRAFADVTRTTGGNGKGAVHQIDANNWEITAPNGAIIHYSSFDLVHGQSVLFIPDGVGTVRVLNRIVGGRPTSIDGQISQAGDMLVYFVNPAGVFFGPNAQVNLTGLQAVGGHLSNRDFDRGVDHYTGLRGKVENAGQITASAVSLVGGQVSNSGVIRADGGWIVMAAGRDVLIGRDGENAGVLLRVEGASNAVFNPGAKGVENTGTLAASADVTDPNHPVRGRVSLGAGDLYGTAIFSNSAIDARRVALTAGNRGNVALGGEVKTDTLDVTLGGINPGELRGTDPTGAKQTINANTVNLLATGANADVKIGDGLALRTNDAPDGRLTVNVEQKKALHTASLKKLDLGDTDRQKIELNLESTRDQLVVDDRALVTGTQLDLTGLRVIDIRGTDPLVVDRLGLHASTTLTDASLIATGADRPDRFVPGNTLHAIDADTNIGFFTNPGQVKDPSLGSVLSAQNGSIVVKSDITTSDGGSLLLEAKNIKLGSFNENTGGFTGGIIDTSGSIPGHVEIRQTSTESTDSVELSAINTQGRKKDEKAPPVRGGDVIVNATGDVTIHGNIGTNGEASGKAGVPDLAGGSVQIATSGEGKTVSVGRITTGGADAPESGQPEQGDISLTASKVIVRGNLDATAFPTANADGARNRSVSVNGDLELGGTDIRFLGGDVKVTGAVSKGRKNPDDPNDPTLLAPTFVVGSSGTTTLGGPVTVDSLRVDSRGGDVIFRGDVTADRSVTVFFNTPGTGVWRTGSDGEVVNVSANSVSANAVQLGAKDVATANLSLGPGLRFLLKDRADDPTTTAVDESAKGSFSLDQDASLGDAQLDALFAPDRFRVQGPQDSDPVVAGLSGAAVTLNSADHVSLDGNVRDRLAGTDLKITGGSFEAAGPGSDLNLASFDLTTDAGLDANFNVTAQKSIVLKAGQRPGDGDSGDLTVSKTLRADSVTLIAGDGVGGAGDPKVDITADARLRSSNGGNSKQVVITQDADLDASLLPDAIVFSDDTGTTPLAGLDLQLASRAGQVTLSGAGAKIAGTNLTVTGQTGIALGDSLPELASLTASTPDELDVSTDIKTSAGGKIELHSGTDGIGDLTISSTLSADVIDLFAGSGNEADTKALVDLTKGNPLFTSSTSTVGAPARPTHFGLQQDAAIGGTSGTAIPDEALFGGGSIAGMDLSLTSKGSTVTVDPTRVAGSALHLSGKGGVTVNGTLDVDSLETTGATTLGGDVVADGAGGITLHDAVTLNAGDPNSPVEQQLLANGGKLTAEAAITKSTAGNVVLHAADALSVGDVATAHSRGELTVSGVTSVKTGALDTSGRTLFAGGKVTVTSDGSVDVGSIDAHGAVGSAQAGASNPATDGRDGGAVSVTGSNVTVGLITSKGGSGGVALQGKPGTTKGGDAGEITLTANAPSGQIRLKDGVLADGGAGGTGTSSTTPTVPANGPDGLDANVSLHGSVQLLASSDTSTGGTASINEIHGNVVTIDGGVGAGTETDDPKVGFTGLKIVAENRLVLPDGTPSPDGDPSAANGISIGGDISAGKLDLEVHHGNLDLAGTGVTRVDADSIRLAATDGHGGKTDGTVANVGSLLFAGSNGTGPVGAFTLEQDRAIGVGGTAIPEIAAFGDVATRKTPLSLGLISQDGSIVLDANDLIDLNSLQRDPPTPGNGGRPETGLQLTLAANGEADLPEGQSAIRVSGGDLSVRQLNLGAGGVGGVVGGNTTIDGTLTAGFTTSPNAPGEPDFPGAAELGLNALVAGGNLVVTGDARLLGNVVLNGAQDQTLDVRQLELTGQTTKTASGLLTIAAANGVALNGSGSQAISNQQGALVITDTTHGLVKNGPGSLLLSGVTADDTTDAVDIGGTAEFEGRQVALRTTDGDISLTATTKSNGVDGVGTYAIHGDVVGAGNVALNGRGNLSGQASGYKFEARRSPSGAGGELTMGGIARTDGRVTLSAEGRDATADDLHPAAIHLKGDFDVNALDVQDTVDVVGDTAITATGDVVFGALDETGALDSGARIEGAKNLSVKSEGKVVLGDDVAMTGGTFAVGGNQGVRFVSLQDTQSIQAGSISLGNGASGAAAGHGSLLRDGGLVLHASSGDVTVAPGQRLIVNGALNVAATGTATLSDTAALALGVTSSKLVVYGGSTIEANSIAVTARPTVTGGSEATFAVPTRNEISGNVPSDEILVRALNPTGQLLAFATPAEGQPFDPLFPAVTGLALFDYARLIPQPQPREPLTRPHADPIDLQAAVRERPLWAEELLGYLEMRSLESPNESGRPTEAEHLPPVGARPGDELEPTDSRVRSAAVENALAAYRELFRGELRRDSESGVIEQPSQTAAIRAAFQAPVDVLRREHSGKAVAGADVASLIESESRFDAARRYRAQISGLLDVAGRALIPDQRPRFRALVLSEVTPYGISSGEFESLF